MKKKPNWFMRILIISFIVFIGLYIASISGYYEATVSDKVALTDKAIAQFEKDVLDGKVVDLNTYILEENKDYSNSFTNAGDKVGDATNKIITDGFGGIWDAVKILFF